MSLLSPDSREAEYIKGIDRRISDLEDRPEQDGAINLIRSAQETAVCADETRAEAHSPDAYFQYPNFFGPADAAFTVEYWGADVDPIGEFEGFSDVGYVNADLNRWDIIFRGFLTEDFPHYAGPGNYVYLAFAAKANEPFRWSAVGTWIEQPDPDPDNWQLYVCKSDGQNDFNDYFRFTNDEMNDTFEAYIADPVVWPQYGDNENGARIVGTTRNRTVVPDPGSEWNFTEWQ